MIVRAAARLEAHCRHFRPCSLLCVSTRNDTVCWAQAYRAAMSLDHTHVLQGGPVAILQKNALSPSKQQNRHAKVSSHTYCPP